MASISRLHGTPDGFTADARTSATLPGFYYHDPAIFAEEQEKIFSRTWQYVGHVSMLASPRDYIVRQVAGESIVVLRDGDGALKAFFNVCQHRAHRLLEGDGSLGGTITCPYHLWSYDLSGRLRGARGTTFERSTVYLTGIRVETMAGFIFVNFDAGAEPMSAAAAGLEDEILSFSPRARELKFAYRRQYTLAANWKNSMENFSECYHCPNQHRSFCDGAVDISTYGIAVHPGYHAHRSRDRGDHVSLKQTGAEAPRAQEFGAWLIWPNTCLEVFPGGNLNIFHHAATGPEETVQTVEWFFPDTPITPERQEVIDFMHVVREEDLPLCESVQAGLRSRGYKTGRFVMNDDHGDVCEHAVHDLQLKTLRALGREL